MKRVRKIDPFTGEHEGRKQSRDMTEETRYKWDFRCLSEECNAAFYWVRPHRKFENTKEVDSTFRRFSKSPHQEDCRFDFENKVSAHKNLTFFKNGQFHLRINFPLGSSWADQNPEKGRLTRAQKRAAENNKGLKAVSSLSEMVHFLEREFGSLEDEALENLVLDYQGRSYPWREIFAGNRHYSKLFSAATDENEDESRSVLAVLRPEKEIAGNAKGKRRFVCAMQSGQTERGAENIKPVITCETKLSVLSVEAAIRNNKTVLMAVRPFVSPTTLTLKNRQNTPVYLYAYSHNQITEVKAEYWKAEAGQKKQPVQRLLFDSP